MTRTAGRLAWLTVVLGAALAIPAGCGPEKKVLGQLKGKVTFKGRPVPAGYIQFMPDATKGNQGAVKVAQIKDGMYDTGLGSDPGIVPGPTVIRIAGFDGKVVPRFGQGQQIFNIYELQDNLAEGTVTKDFAVPDSAADNLKIEPTADR
jgi:hypothetical protein